MITNVLPRFYESQYTLALCYSQTRRVWQ